MALFLIIATAILRVVSTYDAFSQTWDEPSHIGAGMELLQYHSYTMEPAHPPLARLAAAALPYAAGGRIADSTNSWRAGNGLLNDGDYWRTLTLARLGMLPFLVVACLGVYAWGSAAGGRACGVLSALVFSLMPPVLGHSGVAATDMGMAAGWLVSCGAYTSYLRRPTLSLAGVTGVGAGIAIACKLTALAFVPLALLVIWWSTRSSSATELVRRRLHSSRDRLSFLLSLILVVWACFGFSIGPLALVGDTPPLSGLDGIVLRLLALPIYPAPELFAGLIDFVRLGAAGRKSYLLGEVSWQGWWYFFPVVLAVKIPLPALVLSVLGASDAVLKRSTFMVSPAVIIVLSLMVLAPAPTNLGFRHILFLCGPLSLLVTHAVQASNAQGTLRPARQGISTVLFILMIGASATAHPDYLAYFNRLAGAHPERIAIDSDLDWGQDLHRLRQLADERGIDSIAVSYNGSAELAQVGGPRLYPFGPSGRPTGWVAISAYNLYLGRASSSDVNEFNWLRDYVPIERVGRSIFLFYLRQP